MEKVERMQQVFEGEHGRLNDAIVTLDILQGHFVILNPPAVGIMLLGPQTFVPLAWVCKKQGAVSHCTTEVETISQVEIDNASTRTSRNYRVRDMYLYMASIR